MNYGFAPGGTGFDVNAGNYLEWRSGSKWLLTLDPTIETFVSELTFSNQVVRPVGNLGIGCHGHWTGFLDIRLDSLSGKRAHFADVTRVAAAGTIKIPSTALNPRPSLGGIDVKALFRIIGCEIAVAVPYLTALKSALGDVTIVATQHVDSANPLSSDGKMGVLRMLLYDFRIVRLDPFTTTAEAVQAFVTSGHKWFDGTAIPRKVWEETVPADVQAVGTKSKMQWIVFDPPVLGNTMFPVPEAKAWIHEHEPIGPFTVSPPGSGSMLQLPEQRRAFIRQRLANAGVMQPFHSFPLYKQRGYASFDAFIDGYDWHPADAVGDRWTGFRHVYHVRRIITSPPTAETLPFDFVTPDGSNEHLGLPETDPRLFTLV